MSGGGIMSGGTLTQDSVFAHNYGRLCSWNYGGAIYTEDTGVQRPLPLRREWANGEGIGGTANFNGGSVEVRNSISFARKLARQ
jgi:hypothetical protein